jgi:hypothetical protein
MSKSKTKAASSDVEAFLNGVENERTRRDCRTLVDVMSRVTGEPPKLYGTMVGFGTYHYKYASGREGDSFLTGFSPRKPNLTLYIMCGAGWPDETMARLGKHKVGKGCLYVKSLDDVSLPVLEELIAWGVASLKQMYPPA